MRAAVLLVVAAACSHYDPADELAHREYADPSLAIGAILADTAADQPRVFAVGEYHETPRAEPHRSAMSHFTDEILGALEPHAHDLVIESWIDMGCDDAAATVPGQIEAATERPLTTGDDIGHLFDEAIRDGVSLHGLSVTCLEQGSIVADDGQVDFFLLLELIAEKLGDTTRALLDTRDVTGVIVYGGAVHNDLYPAWPLDDLSYAAPLAQRLGGHVLEIDLVAPEAVAPMAQVRGETWFPLLARAAPGRTIVWRRAADSYVVILPAQTSAVAAIATVADRN